MNKIIARAGRWLAIQKRKAKLKNHSFSIISNTCVGGVMTHNVGEQFRSPTVNLIIYEDQFLMFCRHLKEYAACPMDAPTKEEQKQFEQYSYPVGILRGAPVGLPDINLYLVHYKTVEEARAKWEARYRRINFDDIFIVMDRGIEAKEEILDAFHELPFAHKVIFSQFDDPQRYPCNFHPSFYTAERFMSGAMYNNTQRGIFRYHWMDEFDYVRWLNDGVIEKTGLNIIEETSII